ncbi:hypothetical protein BJV78DRAFT_81029 [Lactifluus subvellereus]|nr:hypothetical protein BJV78DRAFT_81029 [Lactifluus subvellereus]
MIHPLGMTSDDTGAATRAGSDKHVTGLTASLTPRSTGTVVDRDTGNASAAPLPMIRRQEPTFRGGFLLVVDLLTKHSSTGSLAACREGAAPHQRMAPTRNGRCGKAAGGQGEAVARPRARRQGRQAAETATGQISIVNLLVSRDDGGCGVVYVSWLPIESTRSQAFTRANMFEMMVVPGHQTQANPPSYPADPGPLRCLFEWGILSH